MKKQCKYFAGAALMAVGLSANAGSFSYNYVQLGYSSSETKVAGVDIDGSGYGIAGSLALNDTFFVTGAAAHSELDIPQSNNAKVYGLTIGARTALSDKVDAYASLSAIRGETKVLNLSRSDTGYGLDAGLRFAATDKLELGLDLGTADVFDVNSTSFGVSAKYKLTDKVSAGIGYTSSSEDSTAFVVSMRFDL